MKTNLSNNFSELESSIKDYLKIHLQIAKLSMLEKLVKITIFTISSIVLMLASTLLFFFAAAAFVIWYGSNYQDYLTGLFIVMGIVVLITLLFYVFRRVFVESYVIKTLSSILLQDETDDN